MVLPIFQSTTTVRSRGWLTEGSRRILQRAAASKQQEQMYDLATTPKGYFSSCKSTSNRFVRLSQQSIHTTTTTRPLYDSYQRNFSSQPSSSDDNDKDAKGKRRVELSKTDVHHEESKRIRLSDVLIKDVLKAKHAFRWVDPVISANGTVKDAVVTTIEGGLSGMMVVDETNSKKVVGLLTSRDILRIVYMGIKDNETNDQIMNRVIRDFMTPISQVIYGRPDETVGMCRTIMAKLGIKCLPILKDGQVKGLITARDMSDFGLSAKEKGGKKSYLDDVSERVGLSANTSMAEPPRYLRAHLALEQSHTPLYINTAVAALPHPFKTEDNVGMNRRDFGPHDYSTNPDLSEDAYFCVDLDHPDENEVGESKGVEFTYMGVADGVGSWREYGVDPRLFSRRLMKECEEIILESHVAMNRLSQLNPIVGSSKEKQSTTSSTGGGGKGIAPSHVMAQAHERVKEAGIVGSCTACIAMFDNYRHQLHFSNLGDSGIIVLRHIDSDVAGALKRNRETPRGERKSDLRVAFVSQQQLISFNHPFQLGWTGKEIDSENESTSFKSAKDACVTSIHVRRGDVIIMATDGLFDNVEVDDIAALTLEWEQTNGFIRGGDIVARERRWKMGNSLTVLSSERIPLLAETLVKKARENSLDSTTDSPFAILAKENDIMWSGGMPDDCTVIAMHVVGRSPRDLMDKDHL